VAVLGVRVVVGSGPNFLKGMDVAGNGGALVVSDIKYCICLMNTTHWGIGVVPASNPRGVSIQAGVVGPGVVGATVVSGGGIVGAGVIFHNGGAPSPGNKSTERSGRLGKPGNGLRYGGGNGGGIPTGSSGGGGPQIGDCAGACIVVVAPCIVLTCCPDISLPHPVFASQLQPAG